MFKTVYIDSDLSETKSCKLTYEENDGTTYYFMTSNKFPYDDIVY